MARQRSTKNGASAREKFFLLFGLIALLSLGACQRINMPYGGVAENERAPAYQEQFNPNK